MIARRRARLTQQTLAIRIGIHRRTLCRFESDEAVPGSDHVKAIAEQTHQEINWFFV